MFSSGLFEFSEDLNPKIWLDKLLHPKKFVGSVVMNGQTLEVHSTKRARKELYKRPNSIVVEMQLYFSCVVKKRVVFHDVYPKNTIKLNDYIQLVFRPIQPTACDPIEFAREFPEKCELTSIGARKMGPKFLALDFKKNQWKGEFRI